MWLQLLNFLIFTVKICNREVRRHTDAMQLVWSWHQTIIAIAKVPNNCVKYDQQRTAQYRGSRTRRDVEQRNSIFGALWNHVVLRNWVKWLEVHQHLISLVDARKIHRRWKCIAVYPALKSSTFPLSWQTCSTSEVCSRSGGWQRCGMGW